MVKAVSSLDNLIETVKKLRERIDRYRNLLEKNEMLTRYVLIDPLLRALGWDTENPDIVRPEEIQRGRAKPDYVLYVDRRAYVAIEAKSLGSRLDEESTVGRCIKYSGRSGIPYYVVTDGNVWKLYEARVREGKYFINDIAEISIVSEKKVEDVAAELSLLGYDNIAQKKKIEVSKEMKKQVLPGGLDVNKAREFYESLTPAGKTLLEIVLKAWINRRTLTKKEIIEEMKRRGIDVDERGFTGIKSGITRLAKSKELPSPLPTEKELGEKYSQDEASRYVLRDEWGRVLKEILASK